MKISVKIWKRKFISLVVNEDQTVEDIKGLIQEKELIQPKHQIFLSCHNILCVISDCRMCRGTSLKQTPAQRLLDHLAMSSCWRYSCWIHLAVPI